VTLRFGFIALGRLAQLRKNALRLVTRGADDAVDAMREMTAVSLPHRPCLANRRDFLCTRQSGRERFSLFWTGGVSQNLTFTAIVSR
jgi:hypothetical protein